MKMMENNKKQPLYKKIAEDIKEMILTGKLKPNDKLPSEVELAEKYKVSRITSREALEELRKEGLIVRKKKYGSYVNPNIAEKMSVSEQMSSINGKNIAMILPFSASKERNMEYIKGAIDYLHPRGYILSVYSSDGYTNKERYYLEHLTYIGVSGIIYYPVFSITNYDIVYRLILKKYPIVLIDKNYEGIAASFVSSDNFDGTYQAAKHLIELGHKNIAFVSGVPIFYANSIKHRFLGYLKALSDCEIEYNPKFIIQSYRLKMDTNKKKQIIKNAINNGVTAFIVEYDHVALDIIKVIKLLEYNVPDDISVVGFDNIDLLDHIETPLTTVEQNFYLIGWKAAELLVSYIETGEYKYEEVKVPVRLVVRSSTSSPFSNIKLSGK